MKIRKKGNKFLLNNSTFNYTPEARAALIAWGNELKNTTKGQGRNQLVSETLEYCCLGILGNLCIKEFEKNIGDAVYLTSEQIRICLHQDTFVSDFQYFFANLNDERNFTFKEISNYVFQIINALDNYTEEIFISVS